MPSFMDMADVAIRASTYKFLVLDQGLNTIGQVYPSDDSIPSITNNINRTIKRSLDGMRLLPSDNNWIDPLRYRLRVMGVLEGVDWPLGTFMWTDRPGTIRSYGVVGDNSLVDFNGILDQAVGKPISYSVGTSTLTALTNLALGVGITDIDFAPITHTMGQPYAWAPDVSRASIMAQLANMAGCYSPYFSNSGTLTMIQPPAIENEALLIYDIGPTGRIVDGTLLESNDLLKAPNRYLAISTSSTEIPVWAVYTVPADAPHSFENRGFYITQRVEAQGISNADEAYELARQASLRDDNTYEWREFEAVPDFRHDTFDVVACEGLNYREQEWVLPLRGDQLMKHSLRRHYL